MNRIKGFTPCSTVDWPGKLVAVVYVGGCNFRCGYCHNPELALNMAEPYHGDIIQDLERQQKKEPGWIDGIVITGGEPTLWEHLADFIKALKRFSLPIRVDTNGSSLQTIAHLSIDRLVNAIALDIKTVPRDYEKVIGGLWVQEGYVKDLLATLRVPPDSSIDISCRTTAIPGLVEEPQLREIRGILKIPHRVQFFRPGRCLDPKFNDIIPFTPEREEAMRKEFNQ